MSSCYHALVKRAPRGTESGGAAPQQDQSSRTVCSRVFRVHSMLSSAARQAGSSAHARPAAHSALVQPHAARFLIAHAHLARTSTVRAWATAGPASATESASGTLVPRHPPLDVPPPDAAAPAAGSSRQAPSASSSGNPHAHEQSAPQASQQSDGPTAGTAGDQQAGADASIAQAGADASTAGDQQAEPEVGADASTEAEAAPKERYRTPRKVQVAPTLIRPPLMDFDQLHNAVLLVDKVGNDASFSVNSHLYLSDCTTTTLRVMSP